MKVLICQNYNIYKLNLLIIKMIIFNLIIKSLFLIILDLINCRYLIVKLIIGINLNWYLILFINIIICYYFANLDNFNMLSHI